MVKYAPRKVYIRESGGYVELSYTEFCRCRESDQTYMDKLFIPIQGCLLEVVREQYTDFYRDKERWRGSSSEQLPLEITDYGWYMNEVSSYDDSAYIDFCTMIHNPNENLIAEFPKAIVTVKNGDGSILATEEQTGSIIMPGDTITLCGMFSMPIADITDDAQIVFDVDWSDFTSGNSLYDAVKTTDFTFSNVSERSSNDENFITGEITNNSATDLDTVNLSIVLRKDGKRQNMRLKIK